MSIPQSEFMAKYTTIRISLEDKKRLERLTKLTGHRSLSDTLRYALTITERELESKKSDSKTILSSLKYAKDIGETNAEDIDKYLYGE